MKSPFQKRFMSKSPLRKHKALQRKLKKVKAGKIGAEGQGGVDYELVNELQKQIQEAKTAHNSQRTEEEDVQVREDEDAAQGSAVEMQSPLHGYVDASDMVDPNPPTAHMWTKVFDAAGDAYKSAIAPKNPCEGLTGDALQKCKNKQYMAEDETKEDTTAEVDTTDTVKTPALDRLKKIEKCQEAGGSFSECNEKFPPTTD